MFLVVIATINDILPIGEHRRTRLDPLDEAFH
jgi:hypothetical protein